MAAPNPLDVGNAFVSHFYTLFDTNLAQLVNLFQDTSMLTFESKQFLGRDAIMGHLMNFGSQVRHQYQTVDAQPTFNGGILILVTGNIYINSPNPVRYSDVFHLLPIQGGTGYWCYNMVIRLNYG
jgi:hypothetical protein